MTREEIDELAKLSHEELVEQYPTIWAILELIVLKNYPEKGYDI